MLMKPGTLQGWQSFFDGIYGPRNQSRSPEEIWLHLVGRAGILAEALRKEVEARKIAEHLCHIFAWLCAFANKSEIQLSQVVWNKYPGRCPYCLAFKNCVCIGSSKKRKIDWDQQSLQWGRDQSSCYWFTQWQEMFRKVYGNVNRVIPRFQVGFHLLEEIGETARVILQKEETELTLEVADVFAWTMGLANKLRVDLNEHLWRMFQKGCPFCHNEVCQCN